MDHLANLERAGTADQPFVSEATGRVNRLAWKTGTSYGYRDSWAMGVSGRWTIGVWLGRPDGTPMPGFYGQSAAVPLLLSVYSRLADNSPLPAQPNTVSEAKCAGRWGARPARPCLRFVCSARAPGCWKGAILPPCRIHGLALAAAPSGADRRGQADAGTLPRCGAIRFSGALAIVTGAVANARRATTGAACKWLCWEGQSAELQAPIRIVALGEGNLIRSQRYRLQPKVLGGVGKSAWFLNGQRLRWDGDQVLSVAGRYQLVVVDEAGNSDRIEFRVVHPDSDASTITR